MSQNIILYVRKILGILLILSILYGGSQNLYLSAQTIKPHHLAEGTFKNNYIHSETRGLYFSSPNCAYGVTSYKTATNICASGN